MIRSVVLDIEGTTSSLAYVRETLFPYSWMRLPDWLPAHCDSPDVRAALAETRLLAGRQDAEPDELVAILRGWIDADRKAAPLKILQGMIWRDAFVAGELVSHVYDDVPPALSDWTNRGLRIYVFSSGSVTAQRVWFEHCPGGSLLPYFSGHFDLCNAGPKQVPESYAAIAAAVGSSAEELLFLSDSGSELNAARAAGLHTVWVRRDAAPAIGGDHREIKSFAELNPREP